MRMLFSVSTRSQGKIWHAAGLGLNDDGVTFVSKDLLIGIFGDTLSGIEDELQK